METIEELRTRFAFETRPEILPCYYEHLEYEAYKGIGREGAEERLAEEFDLRGRSARHAVRVWLRERVKPGYDFDLASD